MKAPQNKRSHTSLENALRALKSFSEDEPEIGVSELAEKLNLAASTTHRLLTSLAAEGFVVKNQNTGKYTLGLSVLQLTNTVTEQLHIIQESSPILEKLTEETGESSHIGIIDKDDVVYLQKADSIYPARHDSYLGKRIPIHCTSPGQAILAFKPEEYIDEKLSLSLKAYTKYTITQRKELENKLMNIRQTGFVNSSQEYQYNIYSIGAPVFKNDKDVVASVNIAGPVQRIKPYRKAFTEKIVEAGRQLSDIIQERHHKEKR
ncbi:IclR family transcriptional regulator [Salibacterium salarium]|uniref:Glycerol operon regulatory protein n=1 Tax=Salibacterium salarium TaxID=284579 RepID=A0A3R9QU83_9BACI|nr:IclR family transcriptional regulator [Salibacterium salarium]RSL33577.1 IclR family transcriptional regulator [Salibacterium salarium]